MKYIVSAYETNRYEGGYAVKREDAPWGDFVATFDGQSDHMHEKAQKLADFLNGEKR